MSLYICIVPIAIYGAESWTLRQADTRQLESFEMRCLRVILGVRLMDRVKNVEIWQRQGRRSIFRMGGGGGGGGQNQGKFPEKKSARSARKVAI